MKYIAVFCSAQEVDQKYVKAAREFARLMAENGYNLVWGGTNKGLMKVIADEVQKGGGKLYGVSYGIFHHLARRDADEMIVAKNLGERKAAFLEKSDAIIALIGGVGTLDEITEIIVQRKAHHHNKPIVILNTDGFYEGLRTQLQKMKDEGFLASSHGLPILEELVYFADTPKEAIEYINKKLSGH
ncbi:MAG: TIGR00730 family Rossman fold protein [Candidatus Micrarchaeota archaeon]|nr:TIGR00730 family Rossman fold protein [Candidatus Micrarchaeota archaeon]